MKFDDYAVLERLRKEASVDANRAIPANRAMQISTSSTISTAECASPELPKAPRDLADGVHQTPERDTIFSSRHVRSVTGSPRTWTGRVVSLDEWRRLSAWERNCPDGRLFCGITKQWRKKDDTSS